MIGTAIGLGVFVGLMVVAVAYVLHGHRWSR